MHRQEIRSPHNRMAYQLPPLRTLPSGDFAFMSEPLVIAQSQSGENLELLPRMANRHGLVAGATGTGKTVTLQVMAEAFSRIGVPVFAADIKGDLSGISQAGQQNAKIAERVKTLKLDDCQSCGHAR